MTTARASLGQFESDFSDLVTEIASFGAEVVFFAGHRPEQGVSLAKELQAQGLAIPIFGGDGFYSHYETKPFIDQAGGATEGSYASAFMGSVRNVPEAASLITRADAAYPTWGPFGPPAYVATLVVLEAAVRASETGALNRAGVLAEVAKTNMPTSVLGIPIQFDPQGEVIAGRFYISQVRDGKFVQVFP